MKRKYPKGEKLLWNVVKKCLEKQYSYICHNPSLKPPYFINMGVGGIIADVIGIKEIGRDWANTNIEVIAVEVKNWKWTYQLRDMDQAKRYSLFAHKCYLATPKEFSSKEIQNAVERGVGLFQIIGRRKLKEILPSQQNNPDEYSLNKLLNKLDYYRCTLCRCLVNYSQIPKWSGFYSFNTFGVENKKKWRFVCEKCKKRLPSILNVATRRDIDSIYEEIDALRKQIKKTGRRF